MGLGIPVLLRARLRLSAAFIIGLLWAYAHATWLMQDRLTGQSHRTRDVVTGAVADIPVAAERGARFELEDIHRDPPTTAEHLPKRIRLNWYSPQPALKAGTRWRLRVSLRPPHGQSNPGGFDYEQWLFANGIGATGYVVESPENQPLAAGSDAWNWASVRQSLNDRITATLTNSPMAPLITALTLGVDQNISADQWNVLRRTGTAHLIAISGSHIGMIAAWSYFAARKMLTWFGLQRYPPPAWAAGMALAVSYGYSALADFAIPTQRALIMVAVAMGAIILRRHTSGARIFGLALLLVTAYDPLSVLSAGFWLSFGAVALIGWSVGQRAGRPRHLSTFLRTNWATGLGLAPVLLICFGQVSLISPVANLLAIPLMGIVLVPMCLFGALMQPLIPELGGAVLKAAAWLLAAFWPVLEWLAALPWAQWTHATPPAWTVLLALPGCVWLLAPRGLPGRWLGLCLLMPALTWAPARAADGAFHFALLDVGQGLAAVIETRNRVLVFDTGAKLGPSFDMGGAVVEPYLRQRGWDRLDTLVVSHGDNDHAGGADTLLTQFPAARLFTGVPELFSQRRPLPCRHGQHWRWDGIDFDMLGPVEQAEKENDNSCVLRVSGAGGSVLLTGDIELEGENRAVRQWGDRLRSDVLVVPHHGSKSSSTSAFLDTVRPSLALYPAGDLNRFGFPHPRVVDRYRTLGIATLNTANSGALEIDFPAHRADITVTRYRLMTARYWQNPPGEAD